MRRGRFIKSCLLCQPPYYTVEQNEIEEPMVRRADAGNVTTVSYRTGQTVYLRIYGDDGKVEKSVKLMDFPEVRQVYDFDCGTASMRAVLTYFGHDVREDKIIEVSGAKSDDEVDDPRESGTNPSGLAKVADQYGLKHKIVKGNVAWLKRMIDKSIPVIVDIQAWYDEPTDDFGGYEDSHYVVPVGYDDQGNIYVEDPSSSRRVWMPEGEFDERWHGIGEGVEKSDHFAMVFWGKQPKFRCIDFERMG